MGHKKEAAGKEVKGGDYRIVKNPRDVPVAAAQADVAGIATALADLSGRVAATEGKLDALVPPAKAQAIDNT